MPDPTDPRPPQPPRRTGRILWWSFAVGGLALVALGVSIGLRWAEEPRQRKGVLLELPVKLTVGAVANGTFVPEHEGPYRLEIRMRCDRSTEEIGRAIGGDLFGHPGQTGLSVWWTVRRPGEGDVRHGTSPERLEGRIGGGEISVVIGRVADGHPVPMEVEMRVERAPASLVDCDNRLVVAASGDWVTYSWLEADVRRLLVLGAAAALLIGLGIVLGIAAFRRPRARSSGP